jgi:hypothetical protein
MYVPARPPTSREALIKTLTHRVLKDARIQRRLRVLGVRDPEAAIRPVAEVAIDKQLLKNAAEAALRKAARPARPKPAPTPVRFGGFYVR